jgi:hypothetical protein
MASRAAQSARLTEPAPSSRPRSRTAAPVRAPRPARPANPARPAGPPRATRTARISPGRRRRARHYALRRRDLALDAVAGLLATILLISLTAGLGVLLLLIIPLAIGLVVSAGLERRRARRARRARPARRSSAAP